MVLSPEIIGVVLYCAQQLGLAFAVGAQTVALTAYLCAVRDGVIDAEEAQFARATQNVLFAGVVLVVLSGAGATLMHLRAGESATVLEPAFLFKWALIVAALLFGASWYKLPQTLLDGLAGGTWYALFLLTALAPEAQWTNLLVIYGVWMVGFNICWWALVRGFEPHKPKLKVITPAPVTIEPAKAAPVIPPPTSKPAPPPAPPPVPKPVAPVADKPTPPPPMPPKPQAPAAPQPAPAQTLTPRPLMTPHNTLPLQKDPLMPAGMPAAPEKAAAPTPMPMPPKPAAPEKPADPLGLSGVSVMPKSPDALKKQ